jgi:hypothetical protein
MALLAGQRVLWQQRALALHARLAAVDAEVRPRRTRSPCPPGGPTFVPCVSRRPRRRCPCPSTRPRHWKPGVRSWNIQLPLLCASALLCSMRLAPTWPPYSGNWTRPCRHASPGPAPCIRHCPLILLCLSLSLTHIYTHAHTYSPTLTRTQSLPLSLSLCDGGMLGAARGRGARAGGPCDAGGAGGRTVGPPQRCAAACAAAAPATAAASAHHRHGRPGGRD